MIPFLNLRVQHDRIRDDLEKAVLRVLNSTDFVLGPEVEKFEENFARYCGVSHAIGVSSGTSALHLALLAAGIGPGDEVITTPMTFVATTAAILYAQATPVFVDIDEHTWNINAEAIEKAITPRTRAIVPVHLHGLMADMDPILEIANRHGLIVIEDAAQAHGAEYKGRRSGGFGHISCFSFYPGKNLGACGEGGAVVTNNQDLARAVQVLRDWGQSAKYHHALKGYNYRMDAIQAAVLNVKLKHLDAWNEARRKHAARYNTLLKPYGIHTPAERDGYGHVYHVYAVCLPDRDAVRRRLAASEIACGMHYPVPVHLQPAYRDLGYKIGDFPITERIADQTLSLPMHAEIAREQVEQVAAVLVEVPRAAAA